MKLRAAALILLAAPALADPIPFLQGRSIVLDPGHAVIDYEGVVINPGKISRSGVRESRVAMNVATYLGEILEKEGAQVYYTRSPETVWRESYNIVEDNRARAAFANRVNAQAFISIHCDWDPRPRVHGVTTFYLTDQSRKLGEEVHRSMVKGLGARNRKLVRDSYTVLDVAAMPAILVETGFISNGPEARRLNDKKHQMKIAQSIAKGIRSYFGDIGVITTP